MLRKDKVEDVAWKACHEQTAADFFAELCLGHACGEVMSVRVLVQLLVCAGALQLVADDAVNVADAHEDLID